MKLAVIAHDGKKADMVAFLNKHLSFLHSANIQIIATGTTGKHAQDAGLDVERVLSGPLGGDAQIAAQVAEGKVQAVFFFKDPLDKHLTSQILICFYVSAMFITCLLLQTLQLLN